MRALSSIIVFKAKKLAAIYNKKLYNFTAILIALKNHLVFVLQSIKLVKKIKNINFGKINRYEAQRIIYLYDFSYFCFLTKYQISLIVFGFKLTNSI